MGRRLQWPYPEDANVLAEYWPETESPGVVAVVETESMEPFEQIRMDWGDIFEIEIFPVVAAEQGLEWPGRRCPPARLRLPQASRISWCREDSSCDLRSSGSRDPSCTGCHNPR